jgi:hypothetical protein
MAKETPAAAAPAPGAEAKVETPVVETPKVETPKVETPETPKVETPAAGAAKAPAKYDLKVPTGGLMDADDLPALEKVARENDMSQEEAQAYLDEMGVSLKAQSDGYLAKLKADPDYGGDKLAESQRLATAFIDRMRPAGHARRDSFLKFLNRGGALNHPEVVALLADAGKLMDEDGHVQGAGARSGAVDTATKMYDHPTSKAADGRT